MVLDMFSPSRIRATTYLTLKDPRERRTHTPSRKKPQNRNDDSQRQTRRPHENVKAKYVDNHSPQNRQCQRHVPIRKQQDRGHYLQHKNHHVKPGHEEGPEELRCNTRGGIPRGLLTLAVG
jgi:hypothetical protein